MSVEVIEDVASRATHISVEGPTQELKFTTSGSDDEPTTRAAVEAALSPTIVITSAFFGTLTLIIQEYDVTPQGNGIWLGTAKYGRRIPRQTGDIVLTFDGTGGTAHITTSDFTTGFASPTLAAGVTIPDFGAIGYDGQNVAGVDVTVPIVKLTFEYYPPVALVTQDYIFTLNTLAGTVNDDTWMNCDPSSVLFLGASGQPRGLDDWAFLFHFIFSPNETALFNGDITNIQKDGHEYVWFWYKDDLASFYKIKRPVFAFVETVYKQADFTRLGLGTDLTGILAGSILP